MGNLSFKNRIAVYNLISAATLVLVVFVVIYQIVSYSVNSDINHDLQTEIKIHTDYVKNQPVFQSLVEEGEWGESEHREIVINPVFVQIFDKAGNPKEKSPNLKQENLLFNNGPFAKKYVDTSVTGIAIRQVQAPLVHNGEIKGYVVIAMSVELPHMVLNNLRLVLWIAFPLVLLLLFFITRIIAGKSIAPAISIIATTKIITDNKFNERIQLPKNKDELFVLATAVNGLLNRIESALEREKQFTSDASHELRTPLSVLKGTMEVLIRKPREMNEYEEKIKYCINEVNRLNGIVDQLLLLARFESHTSAVQFIEINLDEVILQVLERYSPDIQRRRLSIYFDFNDHFPVRGDAAMMGIIIENLLANAIKYSDEGGMINIRLSSKKNGTACTIEDNGIGIAGADLEKIYGKFYRSESTEHSTIKGNGLGLSIVKRLCDILSATIAVESIKGKGTTVKLFFPSGQ